MYIFMSEPTKGKLLTKLTEFEGTKIEKIFKYTLPEVDPSPFYKDHYYAAILNDLKPTTYEGIVYFLDKRGMVTRYICDMYDNSILCELINNGYIAININSDTININRLYLVDPKTRITKFIVDKIDKMVDLAKIDGELDKVTSTITYYDIYMFTRLYKNVSRYQENEAKCICNFIEDVLKEKIKG